MTQRVSDGSHCDSKGVRWQPWHRDSPSLTGWRGTTTPAALHFRLDDGWLVVHYFGMTQAGVIDLRAFLVEPCSLDDATAVERRVQAIGEAWDVPVGPALTSRRLRVCCAGIDLA